MRLLVDEIEQRHTIFRDELNRKMEIDRERERYIEMVSDRHRHETPKLNVN